MTKTLTQIIEGEMHSLFASAKVSFLAYILLLLKVAHLRRPQATAPCHFMGGKCKEFRVGVIGAELLKAVE